MTLQGITKLILLIFILEISGYSYQDEASSDTEKNFSYINIEPYIFLSSIDLYDISNQAGGSISSNTNYGSSISWNNLYSSFLEYKIFFDFKNYNFASQTNTNSDDIRNVINNKVYNYSLGAGIKFNFSSVFKIGFDAMYGDEIFFRVPSSTNIIIDKTYVFTSNMNIYYVFYIIEQSKFGIELSPSIIVPSKIANLYTAKTSYGAMATIFVKYKNLRTSFSYKKMIKDTELFDQTQTDLILKVELLWKI